MRTFIAIDLDPGIKESLSPFIENLRESGGDVRWAGREAMHLTLKFLGEIDDGLGRRVETVLTKVSGEHGRFSLEIRDAGFFPPKKNPRVLWVGVNENPSLLTLQDHLEMDLEELGFPREKKEFHPHITLGRVRSPFRLQKTIETLNQNRDSSFGVMEVRKITFFKSILKPTGAEYSIISEFGLT